MTSYYMNIREMCEEFNVTPRTLRFYEAKELIFPVRTGQRRSYTHQDRGRLKLILQGKRFGFSLEDIRQLLNLYNLGDQRYTQYLQTIEKSKERLNAMISQRDELSEAIEDLKAHLIQGEHELKKLKKKRILET
ncbi:MAG: MerR family DNA-binding transcriptional regulator [Paracoccaceae bacterium]|nr:MerR family DNA-binding transcriptional regulator [Paracoccaceae bacterium]